MSPSSMGHKIHNSFSSFQFSVKQLFGNCSVTKFCHSCQGDSIFSDVGKVSSFSRLTSFLQCALYDRYLKNSDPVHVRMLFYFLLVMQIDCLLRPQSSIYTHVTFMSIWKILVFQFFSRQCQELLIPSRILKHKLR